MVRKGPVHKAKGTKKGRKYGRNLKKCARYTLEHRHEKSHVRRIRRHLSRYGGSDSIAQEALVRYLALL
jgi:hypothetical protein